MNDPLKFTADPVMRDDQPVQAMWAVIMTTPTSWESPKPRIHDWFDTREKAEDYARMLDRSNYTVLAIAQVVYQNGDYIEGYDPARIEKRLEAERQEREARDKRLGGSYRPSDLDSLVRDIGAWGVYHEARAVEIVEGAWNAFLNVAPEPRHERVRVNPGDGIAAAVEAKQKNRRVEATEKVYQYLNEGYRRSAALRNGPSRRGQR